MFKIEMETTSNIQYFFGDRNENTQKWSKRFHYQYKIKYKIINKIMFNIKHSHGNYSE